MYQPSSHITDTGKRLSNDTQQFIFHKYLKPLKNSTNCHFEDTMEISVLGKTYPAEPMSGFTCSKHHDDVAGEKSDIKQV